MGSGWCAFRSFLVCISLCLAQALASTASSEYLTPGFRPPSVPLVVIDPYISVWSSANALYDETPQHWSTPPITLSGMISIDKKVHRFMSEDLWKLPWSTMDQVDLKVYPTQTKYSFVKDGVQLNLTFSTPSYAIPGQLPYLPLTYLTYDVASIDGQSHQVQLYYDNSGEGTVNDIENFVQWSRVKMDGNVAMRIGSQKQTALNEGSNRINWGYWYVVVPSDPGLSTSMASINEARRGFMNVVNGSALPQDDMSGARACFDNWPGLAVKWDLGVVQPNQLISKHLTIIYDQIQSINYFGTPMIPYWRHLYENVETLVAKTNYTDIKQMCETLDANVTSQFYKVGGANYTTIASLAWRQAVGATVTVWNDVTQEVWLFMEEISSDGDVSTVDVVFPASPFFLWWDYNSIQLLLKPILEYAINNTDQYGLSIPYDLPWAPHHLGHWPVCNLHPQDQEQMPVEESGNMLLMIAASVMRDPSHDISWLTPYWDVLITWGDYIVDSLPDPGDQLCTDDFEGKSPHNVNLAAKGILGLGGLSYLLRLNAGSNARYIANKYDVLNSEFLAFWLNRSLDDEHSDWHYRLQFDEPGTWSLKYNLLYQKILNLTIFPKDDIDKELEYYMTKMDTYGIPLDDRANYTKADWLMWTAALGNEDQFNAITDMVYKFAHETDGRHPFPDWYKTDTADILGNFYARPVMGGIYSKLLLHSMYGAKL